jgi:hypothetical protein
VLDCEFVLYKTGQDRTGWLVNTDRRTGGWIDRVFGHYSFFFFLDSHNQSWTCDERVSKAELLLCEHSTLGAFDFTSIPPRYLFVYLSQIGMYMYTHTYIPIVTFPSTMHLHDEHYTLVASSQTSQSSSSHQHYSHIPKICIVVFIYIPKDSKEQTWLHVYTYAEHIHTTSSQYKLLNRHPEFQQTPQNMHISLFSQLKTHAPAYCKS